jgi:hypothetical protein
MNKLVPVFSCALLAVCVTAASAQMTYEATGGNVFIPKVMSSVDLPDGNMLLRIMNSGFSWSENEEAVGGNGSINCYGSNIVNADGEQIDGSGTCETMDTDGDLWWIWWTGAMAGDWGFTGGTGKYAGITGGGTWASEIEYPDGRVMNSWTGSWTIPASEMAEPDME